MPSLLGWPIIVYYLALPRPNLSGWEMADVWLVLTGPLLPLPFQTFAFKIQLETWGSFLTKSLASPCTSTSSLAPATISFASCGCVSLFVLQRCLQPPSFMHLLQVDWTTAARSWWACLWLKLPILIGFFAVLPVSLGAYRNMVLFLLICVTRYIGSQLLRAVSVWRCLLGGAPGYLCELCRPVSGLPGRRALRSSVTDQLLVPRAKTATRQRRELSIVGSSTWNGLPLEIRVLPKIMKVRFAGCFRQICIAVAGLGAPLSRFLEGAPYKFLNE